MSSKIGFTETESKVVLFLIVIFFIGLGIKYFQASSADEFPKFDYSEQDSLFFAADSALQTDKKNEKYVDSEQELLDFSKDKISVGKKISSSISPASININTADVTLLTKLPGIGVKTAQRIVDYRESNGKFVSIDQIKSVKGIGEKKYLKIKEYIVTKN